MTAVITIPRKQSPGSDSSFDAALEKIGESVSAQAINALADRTAEAIARRCRGSNAAVAWSAGKDSLVLYEIARAAGITECVLGMTGGLEYPAMLAWVTEHMPDGLEVVSTGQDLDWLAEHPEMLFPQDAKTAARWFKSVQHTAQARYFRRRGLDVLLLGRRTADGNYTGPASADEYSDRQGVRRYSPLRDWTHVDVLAFIHHRKIPLPPCYGWLKGWRVGTGPWPARQYTSSTAAGWAEVAAIDRTLVTRAASHPAAVFSGARALLDSGR